MELLLVHHNCSRNILIQTAKRQSEGNILPTRDGTGAQDTVHIA